MKSLQRERMQGVWSATPTPFTENMRVDAVAVRRTVNHHVRIGVKGLFLAGTCGEGPSMTDKQRLDLLRHAVKANKGRLVLAVQATENSAARVLERISRLHDEGADMAVVAQPDFFINPTRDRLLEYYARICEQSPLPIGFYDRGSIAKVAVPTTLLPRIYALDNLAMVKDSSSDEQRRRHALAARRKRPELVLLNGNEFMCAEYIRAGYDGLLLGGGIFNGVPARELIDAWEAGDEERVDELDEFIRQLNYKVFGGEKIPCWLSGQKRLCVELGLFRNWNGYYGYPLHKTCERNIEKIASRWGPWLLGKRKQ